MIIDFIKDILRHVTLRVLLLFGAVVWAYPSPYVLKEATLPQLSSWKSVNSGTYRLNQEPINSYKSSSREYSSFNGGSVKSNFKVWTSSSHSILSSGNVGEWASTQNYSRSSSESVNSTTSFSFSPSSVVSVGRNAPRSLAQITVSVETAEEELYPGVKDGTDINGLHIGEVTPIGDGVVVLLLLAALYMMLRFLPTFKKGGE